LQRALGYQTDIINTRKCSSIKVRSLQEPNTYKSYADTIRFLFHINLENVCQKCVWYTMFTLRKCTNSYLKIMVQSTARISSKVIDNVLKQAPDLNLVNIVSLSSLKLAYIILKIIFLPHKKQCLQYKYQMMMYVEKQSLFILGSIPNILMYSVSRMHSL